MSSTLIPVQSIFYLLLYLYFLSWSFDCSDFGGRGGCSLFSLLSPTEGANATENALRIGGERGNANRREINGQSSHSSRDGTGRKLRLNWGTAVTEQPPRHAMPCHPRPTNGTSGNGTEQRPDRRRSSSENAGRERRHVPDVQKIVTRKVVAVEPLQVFNKHENNNNNSGDSNKRVPGLGSSRASA